MAAVWKQNVIVTSYDVIIWCCGPQRKLFWTYYLSFMFRCHSFNILGVKVWGRNPPPPPPPPPESHKTKKSPLWIGLINLDTLLMLLNLLPWKSSGFWYANAKHFPKDILRFYSPLKYYLIVLVIIINQWKRIDLTGDLVSFWEDICIRTKNVFPLRFEM